MKIFAQSQQQPGPDDDDLRGMIMIAFVAVALSGAVVGAMIAMVISFLIWGG